MSIGNGASIVKDSLVLHYDMYDRKSWKGKPTTNLCYQRNPLRLNTDRNYTKHAYNSDATFNSNHPGRISFTSASNGTLSTMVNGGVNSGNWQPMLHAIFEYDEEMKHPVCVMNDTDGSWKAHSFNTGKTLTSLGWSAGQEYSISWWGWTDRIDKAANCGIYYRNSGGTNGFHAGQANSQSTAKNTKPYTWQWLYATFTVPSNMDASYSLGMYNYGHYTGRGVVKQTKLQWEVGKPSHFVETNNITKQTRSNTEALLDMSASGHTLTVNNLQYNSDATFELTGSDGSNITIPSVDLRTNFTLECWVKLDAVQGAFFGHGVTSAQQGLHITCESGKTRFGMYSNDTDFSTTHSTGVWTHYVFTYNHSTYVKQMYKNGVALSGTTIQTQTAYTASPNTLRIGQSYSSYSASGLNGKVAAARMYNKVLTADEVTQNYNATKDRFV